MCRRCKLLGCVLLAIVVGALTALIFPGWFVAALLVGVTVVFGVLLCCR